MTSDIDINFHVSTCTCGSTLWIFLNSYVEHYYNIVAMATVPLHIRSTLKYLAITLIRSVNNAAKLLWKFLLLTRCGTYFLSYTYTNCNTIEHFITVQATIKLSACAIKIVTFEWCTEQHVVLSHCACTDITSLHLLKFSKPKEKWRKTEQKHCL